MNVTSKLTKCSIALAIATLLLAFCRADETAVMNRIKMASPDEQAVAAVSLDAGGGLRYLVNWKDSPIVESSALGITVGGVDLGMGVTLGAPQVSSHDESYSTRGVHTQARNHYELTSIPVTHIASGTKYSLEFRVYDDGVAYRYIVPGEGVQHVDGERSSWTLAGGSKVWFFERLAKKWKLKSYAGEWLQTSVDELETVSPVGPIQGTPIVLELPNRSGYAAITKAATYNYSGMRLKATGNRTLVADFTEGAAGFDVDGTITTPWRVTLLADDLNEMVNSDLIKNLNPAPDAELFSDTSYIKPGRTAWSWETLGLGTPETQQAFIDGAAAMGFEYSTVDDGWKDWDRPWETIEELCRYGSKKNVGVWVWVHSKDILDPSNDYAQLNAYLHRVARVGVVGIKTDFMNAETKEMVDFEIALLRAAAAHKIMINFHGCHASTGEERTYPNEMTREGIRGIEVNKMKEGPLPASHNAALPFTRFVTGHADYTPILFTNPGPTTWAHQIATLVTFTSGLQTYAEHPDTMMNMSILKDAFPVWKGVPSVWDETRVLQGSRIGELTLMARRTGDLWYVGILNGQQTDKTHLLKLPFLNKGEFQAQMIMDDFETPHVDLRGLNPKAKLKEFTSALPCKVTSRSVKSSDEIEIKLAAGGGCFIRIEKQ